MIRTKYKQKIDGVQYDRGDVVEGEIGSHLVDMGRCYYDLPKQTKAQIIEQLKEREIEHDPKMTKAELTELL